MVLEEHGDGEDLRVTLPASRPCHLWHAPDTAGPASRPSPPLRPRPEARPPRATPASALVARDEDELKTLRELALDELRPGPRRTPGPTPRASTSATSAAPAGKVGALFAGQGSQYVNLGQSAVMALPPLRAAFDQANLHFEGSEPLSRIAFPPPLFGDDVRTAQETALRRTDYAQPAIGALSAGQFRYLSELGFAADGFLGHSFGELTALWAAGALDDDDFFALARARGKAMAPPPETGFDAGAMAAVSAPEERVAELLADRAGLVVCNRNAADQIVIGGGTEEVERLVAAAKAAGLRASRLPVSAAFHTPFVGHAVDAFRGDVERFDVRRPNGTVFANTKGALYGDDIAANRKVLAEQLINPVDFAARVEEMYAAGFRVFVEFGPKSVLTQLVRRILGDREHTVVNLDAGPGRDADVALKQAVAQLAVLGLPLATADRYVAAPVENAPTKGMSILLNGINYVSPQRKAAYRDAIDNGYRIAVPADSGRSGAVRARSGAGTGGTSSPSGVPGPGSGTRAPGHRAAGDRLRRDRLASAATGVATATALATAPAPAPAPVQAAPAPAPAPTVMETAHVDSDRLADLVADHLSLHDEYLNGQLQSAERLTGLLERAADQGQLGQVLAGVNAVKEHGLDIGRSHLRANEILRDLAGLELGNAPAPTRAAAPQQIAPAALATAPQAVTPAQVPAALTAAPVSAAPAPAAPQALPAAAPAVAARPGHPGSRSGGGRGRTARGGCRGRAA